MYRDGTNGIRRRTRMALMRPLRHVKTKLTHVPWVCEAKPLTVSLMLAQQLARYCCGARRQTQSSKSQVGLAHLYSFFLRSTFACICFARIFVLIASCKYESMSLSAVGLLSYKRNVSFFFFQMIYVHGICAAVIYLYGN